MVRDEVLAYLRQREGEYLSGGELSRQLGLSRAAVWKAVETLRREGYQIEAHSGRGYCLGAAPDALTEPEIRRFLGASGTVGCRLDCFDEIGSTNTYIKQAAQEGAPDGTVAVANCQTAGRGRMNRSFQSPKGKGIYMTVLLRPVLPPERLMCVTALTGVAICRAVEQVCGLRPGLKWPNDLVHDRRKLCGILTEMSIEAESGRVQSLAVGIGVNVLQGREDFSPDVAEMAASVAETSGRPVSRPELAAAMIREMDRMYADLKSGQLETYLAEFRRDCVNLGRPVQLASGGAVRRAEAVDVDELFGLVVRYEDGSLETIRSGEVSVRGLYGYTE